MGKEKKKLIVTECYVGISYEEDLNKKNGDFATQGQRFNCIDVFTLLVGVIIHHVS
jgi:hypothetical protein